MSSLNINLIICIWSLLFSNDFTSIHFSPFILSHGMIQYYCIALYQHGIISTVSLYPIVLNTYPYPHFEGLSISSLLVNLQSYHDGIQQLFSAPIYPGGTYQLEVGLRPPLFTIFSQISTISPHFR